MRSPVWFIVAGLVALAGFAGSFLYVNPRLAAADDHTVRVVIPGNTVLVLDKPGDYTIYHEKKSTVDGRYYASDTVNGLSLALTADATGAPVKLVEPRNAIGYTVGNRSGTSIYDFTIDRPGRYRLATNLADGSNNPKAVLAIAQGMFGALTSAIGGALSIVFAGLGVAGAIVVAVLWQRSKPTKPVATG